MDKLKLLFLAHIPDDFTTSGFDFPKVLLSHGVSYLNHIELYYKYGFYGVCNYIKEYIKKNGINAIIYLNGVSEFCFDVHFFEELRKEVFVVMMIGDNEYSFEVRDQYYAQAIDLVTVAKFIAVFKFQEFGINAIPYWGFFDTKRYHKIENLQKDIDVSFIGQVTNKPGRLEYINHLLENNINIKTFGLHSPGGIISFENMIEIYNRTKINLNFSGLMELPWLIRDYPIYKRKKQLKGRPLETAMCGGFVLTEYAQGMENLFEIGKEIDVFYDKEELLEKVKYYLEHEEERESIAKRGYERAIKDYDVKVAIPKLIATIDELRKKKVYKPSEIYFDKEFIKNYTTYRLLWIIRFIKRGKWKFIFEELKIIVKYRKLDWWHIRCFFIEEILDKFPRIKSLLKSILEKNKK